jgi:hypothetical protein
VEVTVMGFFAKVLVCVGLVGLGWFARGEWAGFQAHGAHLEVNVPPMATVHHVVIREVAHGTKLAERTYRETAKQAGDLIPWNGGDSVDWPQGSMH